VPDLSLRDRLQPALLERLTDHARQLTRVRVSLKQHSPTGSKVGARQVTAALVARGLQPVEQDDAAVLEFVHTSGVIQTSALMQLTLAEDADGRVIRLQDVCTIEARLEVNPYDTAQDRRGLSMRGLRQSVLRDLNWLLNASNMETLQPLDACPQVASSVLNYGMPSVSGRTTAMLEPDRVAAQIRDAIRRFEPRLSRVHVRVEPEASGDSSPGISNVPEARNSS